MYCKDQNKYISIWKLFLISSFLFTAIGCDSLLPEKFQEKKYSTPEIDEQACILFSDSTSHEVNSRTLQSSLPLVDTTWMDSSDNKIIFSKFDELTDSLETLVRDSLMLISYPAGKKITYAVLNVTAGEAKDISLYTSLNYYYDDETHTTNINEYITVELVKRDTTEVNSSIDMQGETLSGCTDVVVIAQDARVVPVIRARYIVHLEEGVYFVRFILSNPENIAAYTTGTRIRDYYFKIVIL